MVNKKEGKGLSKGIIVLIIAVGVAVVICAIYLNSNSYQYGRQMELAEQLMDEEEYENAIEVLENLLRMAENEEEVKEMLVDAYLEWAEVCTEDSRPEKALEAYEEVLELDENNKKAKDALLLANEKENEVKEDSNEVEADVSSIVEDILADDENSGKILNIYCWNDEMKTLITDYYPGYIAIDGTHGMIGDVEVEWNITPTHNNAYQLNLDATLFKQNEVEADERIDIFLVEEDYAMKYIDTDYVMPIKDLGITDKDIADQYTYMQDVVTDSKGILKGLAWQGCPGGMFYNREAAREIFGTDDPVAIQEYVKDWDSFITTAQTVATFGYKMTSTVYDTYRAYANDVSSPWVVDGKINIDANIIKWMQDSKTMVDAGQTGTFDMWSDDWSAGLFPENKIFCYLGPAEMINSHMAANVEGSITNQGGWGVVEGPQGFFQGGTWICVARGTDNVELVKDIMLKLTTDEKILEDIAVINDDFVNNKPLMEAKAIDSSYSSWNLGGQNPLAIYCANAEEISMNNLTIYDQVCNEQFQKAMRGYFEGSATLDEALEWFYRYVQEEYPELKY